MAEKTPTKKTTKKAPAKKAVVKTEPTVTYNDSAKTGPRTVHALDDAANPNGSVMCGKTAVEGVGNELDDNDVLCNQCAEALMARLNEYADTIDDLREITIESRSEEMRLRRQLAKKDRMILHLVEQQFDVDELDD